ncbi:MAG TPA: nucleotidyl transferase AbiEii/AbiGii toxin family protein [Acidimicrobiales bacterium]|nr:nucleotidyl transferase AbiEii/AbiGii toxin family protein [Acidimicrobiales bacterium]
MPPSGPPPPTTLTGRIVALHEALAAAGLDHAFGGALALAFCTLDPRATQDIDLNVFVGTDRVAAVLDALPKGVAAPAAARRQLERDGQARLRWDGTPVDLFLSNHAFHDAVEGRVRRVPFAGIDAFPVLACEDLAVFKAFLARPKDAVDLAAMVDAGTVDPGLLVAVVADLLGADHPSVTFVRRALGLSPGG